MTNIDLIVTRHAALVSYLREIGLAEEFTSVLSHATEKDVAGLRVCGVLPLSLAVHAASVTEIPLRLTPADRGVELSLDRVRELADAPVTYVVRRVS